MDNQSMQSSHATDTEASSVSKFRSRFKAVIVSGNHHRKATDQYDDLRLRESALRSGVQGSSFDDDLRHHAEDVLLMDPTLRRLSRNSIGSADDVSEMSQASQSTRWVSKVPFQTGLQQPTKKELSPRSVDTVPIIKKEECLKELSLVLENQHTVISGGAQVPSIREDNKYVAIASVETAPSTALDVPPVVTPAVVAVRRVTISDDSRPATAQPCASKRSTAHLPAAVISSGVIVSNKNSPHVNTATTAANRLSGMMSKRMTSQQQQGHTVRLRQASVRLPSPRRPKSAPLTAPHERELIVQKTIDPIDPADKRLQRDEFSRIMLDQLLDKFSKIKLKQEEVALVEPKALVVKKVRDTTVSVASLSVDGLDLELQLLLNNRRNGGEETATGAGVPITSPRTKYLAGCMKNNLNPRASLVLRKHMSKRLELQHHGFGDEMGKLLAECLVNLPFIESINIADNMLTDVGMGPIILAAVNISSLLELNLSQNEIGPVSAKALFDYLINASCTLERLILNNADVDDYECERFVEAIKDNKSLLELELSHNKIGSAENLNTVMPDLVTGGEALADLLRSKHCHLKSLKLDWNMIRMDGAIDLANSIASNKTLTFLDLSYNSLSTQGGSKF
jgi:Leucine-rich repeat (LRR) protein